MCALSVVFALEIFVIEWKPFGIITEVFLGRLTESLFLYFDDLF